MRTPHLVLLFTGMVVLSFSQSSSGHEESFWHPISYDYYHIDLSELGGRHDEGAPHADGGFGGNVPVPREAIVDAINELGVKLLAVS